MDFTIKEFYGICVVPCTKIISRLLRLAVVQLLRFFVLGLGLFLQREQVCGQVSLRGTCAI